MVRLSKEALPPPQAITMQVGACALHFVQGDMTQQGGDAIVTPVKSLGSTRGRLNRAVHRAAGAQLKRAVRAASPASGEQAVATPGFNLPAQRVIHVTEPTPPGGLSTLLHPIAAARAKKRSPVALDTVYASSLQCAEAAGCHSIALPALGTGTKGLSATTVAPIAMRAVTAFLATTRGLGDITFVLQDAATHRAFVQAARALHLVEHLPTPTPQPDATPPAAHDAPVIMHGRVQLLAEQPRVPPRPMQFAHRVPAVRVAPPANVPEAKSPPLDPKAQRIVRAARQHTQFDAVDTIEALRYLALPGPREETIFLLDVDDTLVRHPSYGSFARPMERSTAATVAALQAHGQCLGLTSRSFDAAWLCWFELRMCGIHLQDDTASWPSVHLPSPHGMAGYLSGVVFASEANCKGDFLARIVAQHPGAKRIVFMDDQPSNFFALVLANAARPTPLDLHCVHYTRVPKGTTAGAPSPTKARVEYLLFQEAIRAGNGAEVLAMEAFHRQGRAAGALAKAAAESTSQEPDEALIDKWHASVTDLLLLNLGRHDMPLAARVAQFCSDVCTLPVEPWFRRTVLSIVEQYRQSL